MNTYLLILVVVSIEDDDETRSENTCTEGLKPRSQSSVQVTDISVNISRLFFVNTNTIPILSPISHTTLPNLNDTYIHNSSGVLFGVLLPKNLQLNNLRFIHKTVSTTLKDVSKTFQEKFKVETYVTVGIRTVVGI